MCRKASLISLIALINLIGWIGLASSEKISRNYDLKLKLKPKVVESQVYWQGKERIDWQKEIDNWHFGLLPVDEIIPPIVIDKEDFCPAEEDYSGGSFWGKNNMKLLVFNPLGAEVQSSLKFSADSYKRERTLMIWVNDKMIKKIEISPKEEFSHFEIENISLEPGVNKIRFFCSEGTDKLRPKLWKKDRVSKEVSIKFKEFKFGDLKVIHTTELKGATDNIKCVPQDGFLDIIFSTAKPVIFSRDIDVDLEEFPLFNLEAEFKRETDTKLFTFLGIDYTGDALIDGYLSLEDLGEYNLLVLAKDKWEEVDEYQNELKLKKVILLLMQQDEESTEKKSQIGILRLKDIGIYNDNSLILVRKEFNKDQLRFEDINVKSQIIEEKGKIFLMSYFDAAPFELRDDESIEEEAVQYKKRESEETRVYVSLDKKELREFSYFSFEYSLDDSQIQDIELALLTQDKGEEKIFNLAEDRYEKSEENIEVNLKEMDFRGLDIKDLIIRLKRSDEADCSLPETRGWYQFQLSDLKLCEKFPYPIKSKPLKKRFIILIQAMNPRLLKIDEKNLRLNDFEGWQRFEDLERGILSKRIELLKGEHRYEKLENSAFDVEWVILEPVTSRRSPVTSKKQEPEITFKKVNPTKYLVRVERAKDPFWLVFSESFHKQWRAYINGSPQSTVHSPQLFKEIVADYPKLKVKEARHLMKFTPSDIKYLFKKPLNAEHHLVNGYANGWYIEPKKLGLGEDFIVTLYFWPQSLFYLGLLISGLTLMGCFVYLPYDYFRNKKVTRNS